MAKTVELSDREITAIKLILDTYLSDEKHDLQEFLYTDYDEVVISDDEEHGHIYDELVHLYNVLKRING